MKRYALARARHKFRRVMGWTGPAENPTDYPDQKDLVADLLSDNGWLIWLDGGRLDYFTDLYADYFDGDLQAAWNGSVGYSGDWAARNLNDTYPELGVFTSMPLRGLQKSTYDGRDHFAVAPDIDTTTTVKSRLAALGYKEVINDEVIDISPGHVNERVREYIDDVDGGVIRYLKPHPPLEGFEDLTSGSGKTARTWKALEHGDLTHAQLATAYAKTYRQGLEAAADIIPELDGRVVVTADHGECLADCGQLFHARHHMRHDHLTVVPWLKVDGVV